jgi:hypothetical protein
MGEGGNAVLATVGIACNEDGHRPPFSRDMIQKADFFQIQSGARSGLIP